MIKCLKLSSGEEVLGSEIEYHTNETVVALKDVANVLMMPGQTGQQVSLGLAPFLPYSNDGTIKFSRSHIVAEFDPNDDMLNNYNRIFGSGIQIAKGKLS